MLAIRVRDGWILETVMRMRLNLIDSARRFTLARG